MVKKGDTLIEVTLAIGIFSMIAIAVASVMSSGTSGAQLSLETTLAREEIDAQADTLRFIQNAYTSNKENKSQPLSAVWKEITKHAITLSSNKEKNEKILHYAPTSCADLYKNSTDNPIYNYAFVINPRALNYDATAKLSSSQVSAIVNSAYIPMKSGKLTQASTYPRLIFSPTGTVTGNDDTTKLSTENWYNNLYRAEGIYVIAVTDPGSTAIVDALGEQENKSAYYDFYIRTCWNAAGGEEPSTISTLVRLHDPDAASDLGWVQIDKYTINQVTPSKQPETGRKRSFKLPKFEKFGYIFKGWCSGAVSGSNCNGELFEGDEVLTNPEVGTTRYFANLTTVWEHPTYTIKYDTNGSSWSIADTTCHQDTGCTIPNSEDKKPTRSGYRFKGWCTGNVSGSNCVVGSLLQPGYSFDKNSIPSIFTPGNTLNLKAVWVENNETINVKLTWTSNTDYDSYVYGQKSDGTYFSAYYGNLVQSDVGSTSRTIASLDQDCRGSCTTENFVINTLGGKTYYYYVRNFSSNSSITNATVTVTSPSLGTLTYNASAATGSGRVWNVFAYKDGRIVTPGTNGGTTRSNDANLSY